MGFHARLLQSGKTATGIRVPDEVVAQLGAGKRPPVRVTIRGSTYRTTIAPMGGAFMLPVSAENRRKLGIVAGDEFDVALELDTEAREVMVPTDFAEGLAGDAAAKRAFDSLSYSNRQRIVLALEQARTAETRRRRITSSIDSLRAMRT